jgi:hypothetical protein
MARLPRLLTLLFACACSTPAANGDASADAVSPPPGCTVIDASACNSPTPSYQNDVTPLLNRACNSTCHAPGVGPWPLTDYSDVSDWASIIQLDVQNCAMPPADAGAGNGTLSDSERAMLINWIVCGAPNN